MTMTPAFFAIPVPPVKAAPDTFSNPASVIATGSQMVALAQDFMGRLESAAYFTAPTINTNLPTIPAAPAPVTAPMPTLADVTWIVPGSPADLSAVVPDVTQYLPGPFSGTLPGLVFGTMPIVDYGSAPDQPAIDLNFTYPTLNLNLPVAPSLMNVSVGLLGDVVLPTWTAEMPILLAMPPNIAGYAEGAIYTSTLLSSLSNDLNLAITTGQGLVVGGDIETAMWDRAREREYRQQADALADLERMEELGYAFPPGVYLDARIKVQTETNNTIAGLSREIMVKQAENLLENLKQARTIATELEGKQIDYANLIAQRAFESAKFVAEVSVQIYNAEVEAFKAQLDGYRTQAQVFETLLKAAETQVEIYKAEVEAEKLKVDMNTSIVAQYEALIRAQSLFVDIYKAELGAIETQANLQKIVVEAYGAEIQAYTSKIGAYTAEVTAYKTQIDSQQVIVSAYKTQVDAYAAQVQAGATSANAVIEGYKATVTGYTARLDAYRAQLMSMSEQAKAASEYNTATADVYRSEMSALASYNEVLTKQWQASIEIAEKQAEVAVQAAKANGDLYLQAKNVAVEAIKGGAQVSAQIGAAALNAIHFSTSASWSSGVSQSYAGSIGASFSQVESESISG